MADFKMKDHLSAGTADYDFTLDIACQRVLELELHKNQPICWSDWGNPYAININDATHYSLPVIWDDLEKSDARIILDLWASKTKANGSLNSFYWKHPEDGETYIVRIISKPKYRVYPYGRSGVMNITFFVEGYYAG